MKAQHHLKLVALNLRETNRVRECEKQVCRTSHETILRSHYLLDVTGLRCPQRLQASPNFWKVMIDVLAYFVCNAQCIQVRLLTSGKIGGYKA